MQLSFPLYGLCVLGDVPMAMSREPYQAPLTVSRMAKQGIYLTPTLACYGVMARKPFENFLPPSGQVKNKQVMEQGLAALQVSTRDKRRILVSFRRPGIVLNILLIPNQMAEDAGVTICYGSDLLISMQAFQTEEFTVRSRVLKPAAILKHATINPGRFSSNLEVGW